RHGREAPQASIAVRGDNSPDVTARLLLQLRQANRVVRPAIVPIKYPIGTRQNQRIRTGLQGSLTKCPILHNHPFRCEGRFQGLTRFRDCVVAGGTRRTPSPASASASLISTSIACCASSHLIVFLSC